MNGEIHSSGIQDDLTNTISWGLGEEAGSDTHLKDSRPAATKSRVPQLSCNVEDRIRPHALREAACSEASSRQDWAAGCPVSGFFFSYGRERTAPKGTPCLGS